MPKAKTPPTLVLKTPLSHPVAQWLVIGGLVASLLLAWGALSRPVIHSRTPPAEKKVDGRRGAAPRGENAPVLVAP
jgi:hypothetical protein